MLGEIEHVLRGPVSLAEGDGEFIHRNLIVTVGDNIFRIPLPTQGCDEISKALAVSDEELRVATARQAAGRRIVVPGGQARVNGGAPSG
jgi:hypothetical protein